MLATSIGAKPKETKNQHLGGVEWSMAKVCCDEKCLGDGLKFLGTHKPAPGRVWQGSSGISL